MNVQSKNKMEERVVSKGRLVMKESFVPGAYQDLESVF